VVDDDSGLGIENEVVLNALERKIAAELRPWSIAAVLGEKTSTTMTGLSIAIVSSGRRAPQTTDASGSKIVPPSIRTAMPSAKTSHGKLERPAFGSTHNLRF
jgi:hypothetical protein